MLLKKHKHPFLFTKDEMVQERVDDDTGEAQSTDRGKKNAIHLFNCQESFSLSTGNCLPLVLYIFLYKVVIP